MLVVIFLFIIIFFFFGFNIYGYFIKPNYLIPESNNMIIYYKFELNDISNNKVANYAFTNPVYDLVLHNNPIIDNNIFIKGNSSLYLNGNKQYASIRPIKFSQNGLTIMVWFKYIPNNIPEYFIFNFSSDRYNTLYITSRNIHILQGIDIINYKDKEYDFNINYTDDNWHHLALTLTYSPITSSTSIINIYIDNNLIYTDSESIYLNTSLIFKYNYIGNTIMLNNYNTPTGYINNFRMYNKVLSHEEITSIYNEY